MPIPEGSLEDVMTKMEADPEYQALGLDALITTFKALPKPTAKLDVQSNAWTIHLRYPTASCGTRDEEEMEIAIFRSGMRGPATFPCQRSLLEKGGSLPYLLSVILRAFTEGSSKIMELHLENYEATLSKDAAGRLSPVTTPPSKLQMYRPAWLYFRDAGIIGILTFHLALLHVGGDKIPANENIFFVLPFDDLENGYSDGSGTSLRKDVTFCSKETCASLSISHARCSRCRVAYYCSAEHQKSHWLQHKSLCKMTKMLNSGAAQ